eukprot:1219448-Amphidinium_carterae.2
MEQEDLLTIDIPQLDATMNADYTEEDDIGKAIIDQFFTKMRVTTKQPSHMVNNKEVQQPPDLEKQEQQQDEYITTTNPDTIQPPPRLDIAQHTYVQPTGWQQQRQGQDQTITNRVTKGDHIGEQRGQKRKTTSGDNYEGHSGTTLVAIRRRHHILQRAVPAEHMVKDATNEELTQLINKNSLKSSTAEHSHHNSYNMWWLQDE